MKLTERQLRRLRRAPLSGPNKVALAIELTGVKQADIAAGTGRPQSQISDIVRGEYTNALPLETSRLFSEFFGCSIEDLFPRREALAS